MAIIWIMTMSPREAAYSLGAHSVARRVSRTTVATEDVVVCRGAFESEAYTHSQPRHRHPASIHIQLSTRWLL